MAPVEYACITCGSTDLTEIRKDLVNPRLKCNSCQFVFNGKDAIEAIAAGAITPSNDVKPVAPEPEYVPPNGTQFSAASPIQNPAIPQRPSHVFISKDRVLSEMCSKRDFKRKAIEWSQHGPFDVYELKSIKLNVKVDVN